MRLSSSLSLALSVAFTSSLTQSAPTEDLGSPLNVIDRVSSFYQSKASNKGAEQVKFVQEPTVLATESFKAAQADGPAPNSTLSFAGKAAAKYQVANTIPGIPFQVPISWAGLMPIGSNAKLDVNSIASLVTGQTPALSFWLWGADADSPGKDDLVIWLNGGPGCSSFSGLLEENGPIRWTDKTKAPYKPDDSWTKQANTLFVEQPIGTGFSTGVATARNEDDVARQFHGFFSNFLKVFPELKPKRLWITGESYAGMYVPYITSYFQKHGVEVLGNFIVDGVVTDRNLQGNVVSLDYAIAMKQTLNLTDAQIAKVKAASDKCGYTGYTAKNLNYPPKGRLPAYNKDGCDTQDVLFEQAMASNSYFNVYKVDYKGPPGPFDLDPLGDPNQNTRPQTWFSRRDVQDALHFPHRRPDWKQCDGPVFPFGDGSPPPDKTVLAGVIEKNQRTIIANGQLDGLLITNGTALGLQDLTWNGKQGFSQAPTKALLGLDGKKHGTYTSERGLLFAIVDDSGHMIPEDSPSAGLALLEYMLGRRDM